MLRHDEEIAVGIAERAVGHGRVGGVHVDRVALLALGAAQGQCNDLLSGATPAASIFPFPVM